MSVLNIIIGESSAIRILRARIDRVARTNLPVLIQGPTGSGKELVATALHQLSGRPGPLVAFNVCAIGEAMFEDALFGHVRGAFTGAGEDRAGYLAEANRGTVFLDEIGSLYAAFQAKLLRAIETRQFRPVGARRDLTSDFRLVSASNEVLEVMVGSGRFRRDLAQRLSGVVLQVPPLATRREDIPLLVSHFMEHLVDQYGAKEFTPDAFRVLKRHAWPGNVRELRQVIERVVVLSEHRVVRTKDIRAAIGLVRTVRDGVDAHKRRRLLAVLNESEWDTMRAAERLGVHRGTIYRRMQRLGVQPPDSKSRSRVS
jgi:DNA-binding NtrC family response regulator